jgi:hypothetical protein
MDVIENVTPLDYLPTYENNIYSYELKTSDYFR